MDLFLCGDMCRSEEDSAETNLTKSRKQIRNTGFLIRGHLSSRLGEHFPNLNKNAY